MRSTQGVDDSVRPVRHHAPSGAVLEAFDRIAALLQRLAAQSDLEEREDALGIAYELERKAVIPMSGREVVYHLKVVRDIVDAGVTAPSKEQAADYVATANDVVAVLSALLRPVAA